MRTVPPRSKGARRKPPAAVAYLGLVLVALFVSVETANAQAGFRRVEGVVAAPDETPLEGARVRLYQSQDPEAAPESVVTDESGEWAILVPSAGRWEIEIDADGFATTRGWVQVMQRRTPLVLVELLSLEEGTPAFTEGYESTVRAWIERGNDLLAQNRTSQAREEFGKALDVLPPSERPPVLQAVARTYFLEQRYDDAVSALADGLRIDPEEPTLRQLYSLLLTELGRGDEVDDRLAELAAAGPPEAEPRPLPTRGEIELPPLVEPPEPGRTGLFRTRFQNRSPLADLSVYLDRHDFSREQIERYDEHDGRYSLAGESFFVRVPEGATTGEPLGILVFISPTPFGGFTREELAEVLDERRLIWVGAENAGNGRFSWYRVHLALDAVESLSGLYDIDPRRIYVSGYSGGGRVASSMALVYPEVFAGGLFLFGSDWYEARPVPHQPGSMWRAKFPRPSRRVLEALRSDSRLVFVTGSKDFNRAETKATWRAAVEGGFEHATYIEIPEADHYHGIDRELLAEAIAALDAPLRSSQPSSRGSKD